MDKSNTSAVLPTKYGDFEIFVWPAEKGHEPIALVTKNLNPEKPVLVRIHSECITGDTFGSFRCDCGVQKDHALKMIHKDGNGIFIYLRQEGRGIGIYEKIKAYALQEKGYDTHDANILLGHEPDEREYSTAKRILNDFGINTIRIITNSPSKVNDLRNFGFDIVSQIPLLVKTNKYNKRYLQAKQVKFKHFNKYNRYDYYYGVSGFNNVSEIQKVAIIAKHAIKDPYCRIAVSIGRTNHILSDKKEQQHLEHLISEVYKYTSHLISVFHYSFKNSSNYKKEAKEIVKYLPFVKTIQLNDLEKNHLPIVRYLSRYYNIIFPLPDKDIFLLHNEKFVKLLQRKQILILLDNSMGTGKQESTEEYKEKIKFCLERGINNIGIAGGFGPGELKTYFEIKNYFKINFSIDAETKLFTEGSLDLMKVDNYISELCSITLIKKIYLKNQIFTSGSKLQIKSNSSFETV